MANTKRPQTVAQLTRKVEQKLNALINTEHRVTMGRYHLKGAIEELQKAVKSQAKPTKKPKQKTTTKTTEKKPVQQAKKTVKK